MSWPKHRQMSGASSSSDQPISHAQRLESELRKALAITEAKLYGVALLARDLRDIGSIIAPQFPDNPKTVRSLTDLAASIADRLDVALRWEPRADALKE